MLIARRSLLVGALAGLPLVGALPALANESLPDSRFVGYAQQINDFEIGSGQLALSKSTNPQVRGFATRMINEHTEAASELAKVRQESGITYAPDPAQPPHVGPILQRLSTLDGPDFDIAYAKAQLVVLSEAEQQYGANSANQGGSSSSASTGAVMRFAKREYPRMQRHRESAQQLAAGF
jgi:putative membrane protein